MRLTKTESIIVESLREWPKDKLELEITIDHEKDFSESYIRTMVSRINSKLKMISFDWNKYTLYNTDFDYEIKPDIKKIIEISSIQLLVSVLISGFVLGFSIAYSFAETAIYIDEDVLDYIINQYVNASY